MEDQKDLTTHDQSTLVYGHHLVAFLDLLGQKDRLCTIEGILTANPIELERERLHEVLKGTVGTIWFFRNHFVHYFESYLNHKSELPIPREFEDHFTKVRGNSKINIQNISDAVIAWTPVQTVNDFDYAQTLNSIFAVLMSTASVMPMLLKNKTPLRGGIDIEGGIPIRPGGNEIYGPALNRAYILESKKAEYPRVLVGDGLIDFLNHISTVQFQDELVRKYSLDMADRCRKCITIDDDGLNIIHFLGPAIKELAEGLTEDLSYYRTILEDAKTFVLESENQHKSNEKLKQRYIRLKKYFNRYISDWK